MLCTVDDDNCKVFAIFRWVTPFWYCSTIFLRNIVGIGDPLPILASERHCHSEKLFLYPIMLPVNLISVNWSSSSSLCSNLLFPASYCYLSQLFWDLLTPWNFQSTYFSFKMIHFLGLNFWSVTYILFWMEYWHLPSPHHCIQFLFTICLVSQLFWNPVCNKRHNIWESYIFY